MNKQSIKLALVLGTRPEIIKLSSIIRLCHSERINHFILHTNQHYSPALDQIFFKQLKLEKPRYNLNCGSATHGKQTGEMLTKIEEILLKEKPTHVIVQGDTNSVLAGALAASKLGIKICHVEAGLRSYDRAMPEEINRVLVDHISDYLFCPTQVQKKILQKEGIDSQKIHVVGNTIVDAVYQTEDIFGTVKNKFGISPDSYILFTMHRPSNVDDKKMLKKHLENISVLAKENKLKVIFPAHPRTVGKISAFKIRVPDNIQLIDPVGFLEMIALEKNAKIIATDSGGIQEEGCILGTPTLNLRDNTERPECIKVGASKIVGSDLNLMRSGYTFYLNKKSYWKNPFGDGQAASKILDIINKTKFNQ